MCVLDPLICDSCKSSDIKIAPLFVLKFWVNALKYTDIYIYIIICGYLLLLTE